MRKIKLLLLVFLATQSCQGHTEKNNPNTTTSKTSASDIDDVMDDLEGILEAIKSNDYDTLKQKYLPTREDIQDFAITYGQNTGYWRSRYGLHLSMGRLQFLKTIKGKLVGTNINTKANQALYLIADGYTTLKGIKRRKLTLIFGDKTTCYEMELYLIVHNGKRLYAFKKEIDKMSMDYSSFKSKLKDNIKQLKENDPDEYKQMAFEEY